MQGYERKFYPVVEKMVDREVWGLVNELVEKVMEHDFEFPYGFENVETPKCPECGEGDLERDFDGKYCYTCDKSKKFCECSKADRDRRQGDFEFHCTDCGHVFDNPDYETAEIYQWFSVSDWLRGKLEEVGECVYDGYPNIWGRQGAGQAVAYDWCMWEIARNAGLIPSREEYESGKWVEPDNRPFEVREAERIIKALMNGEPVIEETGQDVTEAGLRWLERNKVAA